MTAPEHDRDEVDRSELAISFVGPRLAAQAAAVLKKDPDADPVGLAAEAGSLEARRCRTQYEQLTGVEIEGGGVAVVLPKIILEGILDREFPPAARDWLYSGIPGQELRYVICTQNGFRLAAVPIPPRAP
jgi:hypothetical protein